MREVTLLFILSDEEILLAMKKKGFGAGKVNGLGGKVAEGERIERAAVREAHEEAGILVREEDLEKVGEITFRFKENPDWNQRGHIFVTRNWKGEPRETEEMYPYWELQNSIPYEEMWAGDRIWLPRVLDGERIRGELHFGGDGDEVEHFVWHEV